MSFSVKSNKNIYLAAMQEQLEAAFEECGLDAEYYAARDCPVDTGRLRASITHEVDGIGAEIRMVIGTNVEYAPYVENGTTRQRPQPFIKPSIGEHIGHYQTVMLNDAPFLPYRSSKLDQRAYRAVFADYQFW